MITCPLCVFYGSNVLNRFSKMYVLLCGLWYDREKPTMITYFRPLMNALNVLLERGKCRNLLQTPHFLEHKASCTLFIFVLKGLE